MSLLECKKLSRIICKKLFSLDIFQKTDTVLLYSNIGCEVMTEDIAKQVLSVKKCLAYPKVFGDEMNFYKISSLSDLKKGYMNIDEPNANPDNLIDPKDGVIIVPGLAFDKAHNRTGYGRGYYDRYLLKHPSLKKVGLGFSYQIFDELEVDCYDIPLDFIITEKEII